MSPLSSLFKNRGFRVVFIAVIIVGGIVWWINRSNTIPTCKDCNLILISVDTLRPDHMGVYGYDKNTTPNIDAWAKNATVFNRAYTILPETWESFYTLFTGREDFFNDPQNTLKLINDKNSSIDSLQIDLHNNKYKTSAFVTNPALESPFFLKGFDEYNFINKSGKNDITSYSYDYENSVELTAKARDWLEKNSKNKFFLWLHYTNPHGPYNPPSKYICQIDKKCDLMKYKFFLEENPPYSILKTCQENDPSQIQLASNLYDAEILSVDEKIGEILTLAKKLNILKKTLIVIYGDHGEGFDHDNFSHANALYESHIRIPFIIIAPGNSKKTKVNELIDNMEIKNILLSLLDNHRKNDPVKSKKIIFSTTSKRLSNTYSLVTEQYKYIYSFNNICTHQPSEELYDIIKDPNELNNIVDNNTLAEGFRNQILEKVKNIQPQNKQTDQQTLDKLKSLGY